MAGIAQLPLDSLAPDLVQLVERDEEIAVAAGLDAAEGRHRAQDPSVVQADTRTLEPELDERLRGRQDELDLGDLGDHAQDVDVALGELPEAALLRALGAPDRPDLDRLERVGQLGSMVGIVPRERYRQIEAQPEIGEIIFAGGRGVELGAALENLVDQLLVLAAAAAL